MTSKNITLSIVTFLVLLASFAIVSAAPVCSGSLCIELTQQPLNVSDGSTAQVRFNVNYSGSTFPTTVSFSTSTASNGAELTVPNSVFTSAGTNNIIGVLSVPQGKSGVVSVDLRASANGESVAWPSFSVPINVDKSLSLTQKTSITSTRNGVIEVENTGNTNLVGISLDATGEFNVDFSSNNFNLNAGEKREVTVTPTDLGNVGFEGKSITVTAGAADGTSDTLIMSVLGSFCRVGSVGGNLSISDVEISNNGEGDDTEWELLDEIEVEIDVENEGEEDVDDVIVRIGVFDSEGNNVVDDLEFESADEDEIEIGDLGDGDEETATFTFKVPADFEDGNYQLTVKVYSDDLGESNECDDTSSALGNDGGRFEEISVDRETDEGKFIVFDNYVFSPQDATCSEKVMFTFDAYNIGDEEQDRVRISLINSELGINQEFEILNDLDEGDKETISMELNIPANAVDKSYSLRLSSDYDYRNGNYRETSDSDTLVPLKVIGCGNTPGETPSENDRVASITASLESDAAAGQKLTVKTTITNLLDEEAEFSIDVSNFDSWATLDEVSDETFSLDAGESRDIEITFTVDDDASGEESFEIEASTSAGSESRDVVVNIGEETSGSGGLGGFSFGENSYLWIIGIVNVILIVLIIVVAVRISRR